MEKSEVKAIKVLASLSGITSLHFKFCKEIVIRETKFSLQNKFDYNSKPKSEQKRIDKFIEKEVIRLNQYFAIINQAFDGVKKSVDDSMGFEKSEELIDRVQDLIDELLK